MENIEGYCIITTCLGADEIGWKVMEEDGKWYPEVYDTLREAQISICEERIDDLQQFIDGEREFDEIDLDSTYVANIIVQNDKIQVWEIAKDNKGAVLINTTLKEWQNEL